jgi:hypothetical protein
LNGILSFEWSLRENWDERAKEKCDEGRKKNFFFTNPQE